MAEEIYQNIVRKPDSSALESVHLCDLPHESEAAIDLSLSEEMAAVRNAVSLGLRVRTEHKIKVRQPLSNAEVILNDDALRDRVEPHAALIAEELNVHEVALVPAEKAHVRYVAKPNFRALGPRLGPKMKLAKQAFAKLDAAVLRAELLEKHEAEVEIGGEKIRLEPADVEVLVEAAEHFAAAGDRTTVVVLNTDLDQRLLDEGLYREILRRVQDARKDLGADYTDRIRLAIDGSERVKSVVETNREHLMGETLCTSLAAVPGASNGFETREYEIDGEALTIGIARA